MRLNQLLGDSAARLGAKTAIVAGDTRHSYGELDRKSDRLAAALAGRDFAAGDRLAVFLDDGFEAAVAIFAALKANGVVAPIDPATAADDLAFVLDRCQAAAIVTQARLGSVAAAAMCKAATVRLVVLAGGERSRQARSCLSFEEAVGRLGPGPAPAPVGGDDDPAVLACAPLAVGMAEPVVLTHAQVAAALDETPVGDDESGLPPPISSTRGLYGLLKTIKVGATLTLERRIAPRPGGHGGDLGNRAASGSRGWRRPVAKRRRGDGGERPWSG